MATQVGVRQHPTWQLRWGTLTLFAWMDGSEVGICGVMITFINIKNTIIILIRPPANSSTTLLVFPTPSMSRLLNPCLPYMLGLARWLYVSCGDCRKLKVLILIVCLFQLNGKFWFGDPLSGEKFSKELKNVENPRNFYNQVSTFMTSTIFDILTSTIFNILIILILIRWRKTTRRW